MIDRLIKEEEHTFKMVAGGFIVFRVIQDTKKLGKKEYAEHAAER